MTGSVGRRLPHIDGAWPWTARDRRLRASPSTTAGVVVENAARGYNLYLYVLQKVADLSAPPRRLGEPLDHPVPYTWAFREGLL